jgi:uncharacterized membrane protein YeiB
MAANLFYNKWRELCAIVFVMLVVFDFIIAPSVYEAFHKPISLDIITQEALKLSANPNAEVVFITSALQIQQQHLEWQPLTLGANGMLYLVFMAVLGIASWKSGTPQLPPLNQDQAKEAAKEQSNTK